MEYSQEATSRQMMLRRWGSAVFGVWMLVVMVAACDSNEPKNDDKDVPTSIEFRVDGENVYYRWREPDGTMTTAQSLAGIPLAARPAVAVFVSGETPSREDAEGYYVANLLEASAGDAATATLRKPIWLNRAGEVTDRAARIALSLKEEVTPEPPDERQEGMSDHELRDREVDLSKIEGSARKANLFGPDAGNGEGGPSKKAIDKVVGSEVAPERRSDGRPATDQDPVTEEATEGSKIGESDPEPTMSDDGEDGNQQEAPSRQELRQRLEKAKERGVDPSQVPEMSP